MGSHSYSVPYLYLTTWVNRRRAARLKRQATDATKDLSHDAWVEYTEHVPSADDPPAAGRWINPHVLPTPVRDSLRGRCRHQGDYLVARYFRTGAVDPVVPFCSCSEATCPSSDHDTTPTGIAERTSASAWSEYMHNGYGGEA